MQQSQLIESIKNPSLLVGNTSDLLHVMHQFPYCQTAQLMVAVQLKNNNDILFEDHLKKAAAYCTDRHHLFKQLHQSSVISSKEIAAPEKELEKQQAVVDKPTQPTKKSDSVSELEKDYLAQAINSSILLETTIYEPSDDEDTIEKTTEVATDQTQPAPFDSTAAYTFTDWLSFFNQNTSTEITAKNEENVLSAAKKFDLIDKFIQEDPKIQPKKTEFYSPVNMARLSVVDNLDMVSETLALVHVDQGNYQKAISMYEKLSLKFPKKRSYFASQIKNLKQKLK